MTKLGTVYKTYQPDNNDAWYRLADVGPLIEGKHTGRDVLKHDSSGGSRITAYFMSHEIPDDILWREYPVLPDTRTDEEKFERLDELEAKIELLTKEIESRDSIGLSEALFYRIKVILK